MRTIKLEYFKRISGKYYSEGEYQTAYDNFHDIVDEVRNMQIHGRLPGLVPGAKEFIIYLPGENFIHKVPQVIP